MLRDAQQNLLRMVWKLALAHLPAKGMVWKVALGAAIVARVVYVLATQALGIAAWQLGAGVVALVALAVGFFGLIMTRMGKSVKPCAPTEAQLRAQPTADCVLFRFLPALTGKIAWCKVSARGKMCQGVTSSSYTTHKLGHFPTPVHAVEMKLASPTSGTEYTLNFQMKREDMSSERYGGNKVRFVSPGCRPCVSHSCPFPSV